MADLRNDLFPDDREPIDPVTMARRDLQKTLPKRFYTEVAVGPHERGHALLLDGKPVRTPAKDHLVLPTAELAERLAAEWRAQTELIDPATMPLTKLANSAIDGVAKTLDATAAEVAKFAETDLVCYRAGGPAPLVAAQSAMWDPILAFAHEALGARFLCVEGVMYVAQPEPARLAVAQAVDAIAKGPSGALKLAALNVMTTLTGSVLTALAVARTHLTAEEAWATAHVDEDFQARFWGTDADAIARRERRWRDMAAAAETYRLS
ncbi:ATP12 family chaperone protein [Beijerinckia sp. L45]|uniref:ATP12 family chaperone protein n=1 Tax=Beijerinckia sp. L45 TaxID=1641855 RepID=UPI00131BF192|nr:ATP12 family protein [Beijerinckia sp. L45]